MVADAIFKRGLASAHLGNFTLTIDKKNCQLVHRNNMLANQLGKFRSQHRLRGFQMRVAKCGCLITEREQHTMLCTMAFTHLAAGLLHQQGLVIEMRPHELRQSRHEKCKLDRLTRDRALPPVGNRKVVRVDHVMTKRVLPSDQWTDVPDDHLIYTVGCATSSTKIVGSA